MKASTHVKIGAAALLLATPLIMRWEGYVPYVYRDPIGRAAACWGHDDQTMTIGRRFTRVECEAMLQEDVARHAEALSCITVQLKQHQQAAFISFTYNVGRKAFCNSTLVKRANAGDLAGACAELSRWTFAGGRQLPGLIKRRANERAMCEGR